MVTDTGAENLTAAVPAEVEPLYALIRQKGVNLGAGCADRAEPLDALEKEGMAPGAVLPGRDPGNRVLRNCCAFRSLDAGRMKRVARAPAPGGIQS